MAKKSGRKPNPNPNPKPKTDIRITGYESKLGAEFHDILEELGKLSMELEAACNRQNNARLNKSDADRPAIDYTDIDEIIAKIDKMFIESPVIKNARLNNVKDVNELIKALNEAVQTRLKGLKAQNRYEENDIEQRKQMFDEGRMNKSQEQLDEMESFRENQGAQYYDGMLKGAQEALTKAQNEQKAYNDFMQKVNDIASKTGSKDPLADYSKELTEAVTELSKLRTDLGTTKDADVATFIENAKKQVQEMINKRATCLKVVDDDKMFEFYQKLGKASNLSKEELDKLLKEMVDFVSPLQKDAVAFSAVKKEELDRAVTAAQTNLDRIKEQENLFKVQGQKPNPGQKVDKTSVDLKEFGIEEPIKLAKEADAMSSDEVKKFMENTVNGMSQEVYEQFSRKVAEKNGIKRGLFESIKQAILNRFGVDTKYQALTKSAIRTELDGKLRDLGYADRQYTEAKKAEAAWQLTEEQQQAFDKNARKIILEAHERGEAAPDMKKIVSLSAAEAQKVTKEDDEPSK